MARALRRGCSALVYVEGEAVVAEDSLGDVISSGQVGSDDAAVIQAAIDSAHPSGEVRISRGTYCLQKPIVVSNSATISGEGRGTVIVPPAGDYAFKVMTTDDTETFRPYQPGGRLYAVIVRGLAIDGKAGGADGTGKGIYLNRFWSSVFEDLWIENTSTALHLHQVHESCFSRIYMIANGNAEAKEPSVFFDGQCDNIHMSGVTIIYPNYVGLQMIGSASDSRNSPRLVWITDSMIHGWLAGDKAMGGSAWDGPAPYDLIQIRNCDTQKDGRTDITIANSRITVAAPGCAAVNVSNSPVTIRSSVITATKGECVVRASDGAQVRLIGNAIHGSSADGSKYAVLAENAEVLFKDNRLAGKNLQIALSPGVNSIIADNRFAADIDGPAIAIGDDGKRGSSNIQVRGNVFSGKDAAAAIAVSPLSTEGIDVHGNQFVG